MKKKVLLMGTCVVLGVALLFTTAFASKSTNAGYETYKNALKSMSTMESFTGNFQATITDNNELIAEINSKVKADHMDGTEFMSSDTYIKTNKDEKSMESYVQDGKAIMKSSDSDTYVVYENKNRNLERRHEEHMNPENLKDAERVLDAMVGDLQNYVMVNSKNDGGSTVTMQLDDSQIPAVINALASMGIKGASLEGDQAHNNYHHGNMPEGFDFGNVNMPKLVDDIKVNSVDLIAEVSKENLLEKQTFNVVISGSDKDGKAHEVKVQLIMNISDVNNTIPQSIDLTGKNVKIMEEDNEYNR